MLLFSYLLTFVLGIPSSRLDYENKVPLITAHRGSMWYFPEHTSPAYYYSFFEGADFIDADITPTKDNEFVIFHDPIITTADVEGLTPDNGFLEQDMN